jgi:hypothetical protein
MASDTNFWYRLKNMSKSPGVLELSCNNTVGRNLSAAILDDAAKCPHNGGMKRGCKPHYTLKSIKAAFADAARINWTMTATIGAEDLGMDEQAVVDAIAGLAASDFDKSMPSDRDPSVWQDVYKPMRGTRAVCEIHFGRARRSVAD